MSKLLSIIIPCYNDPIFVSEAVKSAKEQTYSNKEIIIINDGSNELTKKVLDKIVNPIVSVVHQKNKGISGARNRGFFEAKGEYIMLLDSDDIFDKTFAEKAITVLNNNNSVGVVTCWGKRFIDDKILSEFKPIGGNIDDFLFSNSSIGTSMIRKTVWDEVGGYDEQMKKGYEDWEFYIRATQNWQVEVIPEFLFFYRQRIDSMRVEALNHHDLEIKKYIYNKHKDLYIKHYDQTISYLLGECDIYKKGELKQQQKLEFRIGQLILKPFRFVKRILNG